MTYVTLRHAGVSKGHKVGGDTVPPPQLAGDAPVAAVLQPVIPDTVVGGGNQLQDTILHSLLTHTHTPHNMAQLVVICCTVSVPC